MWFYTTRTTHQILLHVSLSSKTQLDFLAIHSLFLHILLALGAVFVGFCKKYVIYNDTFYFYLISFYKDIAVLIYLVFLLFYLVVGGYLDIMDKILKTY